MGGGAMPMQARSRYYPRLADAKLLLRLRLAKSQHKTTLRSCLVLGNMPPAYHPLSTEVQQRFSMGTVLTHPFLCLNRYKQNNKTAYIIRYHSTAYSLTSKPEKREPGGWRDLLLPTTMQGNLLLWAELFALYVYTAVGNSDFRQSPGLPFSGLFVRHHHVATAKYNGLLRSEWGAVAGL